MRCVIKWKGLPDFEASWEPAEMFAKQFPEFHLEDKESFEPGVLIDHLYVSHAPGGKKEWAKGV